ncbi:Serine/threonine-protein kinase [Aspergillus pseudoustus]|uniref:non-specific serine/threonine protein kinase n=1 Tax=Aspergillus pseudoustus TaxID=1810923 RepID=A0ABR4KLN8_9EURO
MPHHPKKSATNALKNGSPRAEKKKKHVFPEPASIASPSVVTTNYQEIHQNEVEALRSIYGDDFEEVQHRPSAWHQSSEVSFKLHLRASSNPDVRLDLLVSLPTTYPKTCPNITPENLEDLRRGAQSRVRDILRNKPKTLLGSEMIYELGVSIQDVLEDAAEAQAHDQDLPSLEEERMVQEAAATERAERAKEEELRAQQAATAKEEQELQLLLQNTIRERTTKARLSRRKSRASGLETNGDTDGVLNLPGAITFDPPLVMSDTDEGPLLFRAVFGKTLLHSAHGVSTFVVRPALPANRPCAPLLVLKELSVDEKKVDALAFREEMRSSEDRLEGLKKLRHPNLVEFIGFKILSPLDHTKDSMWTVFALVEYANKGSLSELLDMAGTVAIEMLRSWTIQLLEALEYYHRNGFVHGDIHCGRVLLFRNPTGGTIVKLLSSIEGALPDPANSKRSLTTSKSPFWLPPELTQERSSPTMKTDVWDLGIVFLQMGFGSDVLQRYTSANALMMALDLSPSLQDLLQEFFRPNPKRRPTAFQLQPSEFFRIDSPLLMRSSASNSMSQSKRPRLESISAGVPSFSRYNQDFDEAGRLGKGGFGEVVKARNKLDGRFYAVKKISHKSTAALKDTLSEIMLLSRLNHPYVVRYYTAWLEEDYGQQNEEAVSFTDGNSFASTRSQDFDYSTTGGLDFISSSGYPNIEFANDSDEDDCGTVSTREKGETPEAYGTESSTGRELSLVRSGSQGKPTLTTLYIQMEYCERHTLRDLIKNGLYDDVDRSWRLFRQILDGLTHIHGHGIIHRDLKPDNIFIDAANNPRIGDFGLATSGQFTTAVRSSAAADFEGNLTRSLGTTYYVAPEMKSGFSGHYNEKVDMYSMGVIFFEMCHSLPTNMERDQTLRAIREKHHILPATFKSSEKAVQGKIIESLLNHNPGERPSASELLQSGQIPLQVEEETFRRAIMHLLSDPASPDYKKILSAIFSQSPKKFEDIAWDVDSRKAPAANELLVRGLVKERLTSIFRRHGAVEATRQMLFPKSQHYKSGAVRLLDASGNALQLPFDLTLPNARAISRQDSSLEKTFTFGTVYRETPHGGEPRTHKEVDFDIVSRNTLDLALKEAEVIKVLDEVIEEFPPLRASPMCFLINHSDLLQLIMEFCRITPSQIPLVKEVISRLNVGKWPMQKIRSELRSPAIGVASTSLDDLARFDFRDTPKQTQKRLRAIMEGTEFAERLTPIFARINSVISYLQGFEVKRKVYINPLGSLNDKFFRGSILFQCIFDSKRREVFAAGGRYDSLVQDFRPTVLASRSQTHAVGFNLSWDMLSALMIEYLKAPMRTSSKYLEAEVGTFWKTRRCDVLVASFDPTVLREMGVKLTQDLWANDISAELAVDASSLEELLVKYKEHNHSWIVIAKQDSKDRGFKVRCLVPKEEFDIRNTELIPWLRNEIRARNTREGAMDNSRYSRLSQSEANAAVNERANDVRILVSQHRSKKTNRRNIVESALLRSREVVEKALDGPIAAIDTRDDLLEAIRDTRLSDPDSWRTVIQNAPLTERKYLGQVQDLLTDLASESRAEGTEPFSNAFIYNFRTGSCINYDLKTGNDR